MNHFSELQRRFDDAQTDLARIDVNISYAEMALVRTEKYTLEYYHHLEKLIFLQKKRQMIVSRLADIRLALDRVRTYAI